MTVPVHNMHVIVLIVAYLEVRVIKLTVDTSDVL